MREEVRLSMSPDQQIRLHLLADAMGVSFFGLVLRLLEQEWDATFGGDHAGELTQLHEEIHGTPSDRP